MADLPDISPDLDQPLPQVDPNSDLVPYRMARTDPGQQPVVTTGYGPRARPPISPPGGGGVGAPDMSALLGEALQHLPVDEALKATEAATRYIGQRGYMRDIQSGANAAQAFAKWGPMLFHQATGIPEAIDRSVPTPITPYQQAQLSLRKQQLAQQAANAKAKLDAAAAKAAVPTLPPEKKADLTDAYKELDQARREQAKLDPGNIAPDETMDHQEAVLRSGKRVFDARQRINKIVGIPPSPLLTAKPPTPPTNFAPKETQAAPAPTPNPANPVKRVRVVGPGGKKGTVPEGATLPEGWKLAE